MNKSKEIKNNKGANKNKNNEILYPLSKNEKKFKIFILFKQRLKSL